MTRVWQPLRETGSDLGPCDSEPASSPEKSACSTAFLPQSAARSSELGGPYEKPLELSLTFNPCHSEPASSREESAVSSAGLPQSAARSSHVGLSASMRATFFSRRHFLISVSRSMALFA